METQILEPTESTRSAPPTGRVESDIFDVPTQRMAEPDDRPVIQNKRIPVVMTQSSQPANTPEWSLAARLTNVQIDQCEKALAATAKQKDKLKKHRFLFATSSDEEDQDDDDDLEFDLAKPNELISVVPVKKFEQVRSSSSNICADNLKRSMSDAIHIEIPTKKKKIDEVTSKISTRRLSVNVSRDEVQRHIKNEAQSNSTSRNSNKKSKGNANDVPAQRNLRKKTEEVHQTKRMKNSGTDKDDEGRSKLIDSNTSSVKNGKTKANSQKTNIPENMCIVSKRLYS